MESQDKIRFGVCPYCESTLRIRPKHLKLACKCPCCEIVLVPEPDPSEPEPDNDPILLEVEIDSKKFGPDNPSVFDDEFLDQVEDKCKEIRETRRKTSAGNRSFWLALVEGGVMAVIAALLGGRRAASKYRMSSPMAARRLIRDHEYRERKYRRAVGHEPKQFDSIDDHVAIRHRSDKKRYRTQNQQLMLDRAGIQHEVGRSFEEAEALIDEAIKNGLLPPDIRNQATYRQRKKMGELGIDYHQDITRAQASALIETVIPKRCATPAQLSYLKKLGVDIPRGLTLRAASELISSITQQDRRE